ncbi:carbohydrate ABC transporter permease [Halotalea alkalilenta]|uniref:ABC transporter permease n=1 Tax=Halotalea alkalilenta TaxID=376489 RepID=A0A172YC44_9GAMM|nr:sugar ABC transporter permease [Halotalea alkalilenta]ANF56788.1 ABC transporter permease [Halotalea alkalilenta]
MSESLVSPSSTLRPRLSAPARRQARSEALSGWILASPAMVLMAMLILLPMLAVVWFSLTDYQLGYPGAIFIGLENYRALLDDPLFLTSLGNTLLYTAIVAPLSVALGLGTALLIESETRGRAFFRTVYFLPVASLLVAMATVWQYLMHPQIGMINQMLALVGLEGRNWLGASDSVLWSLAAIGVWQSVGFNMVLFLAGLTAIPRELYAAARIDGAASAWQRFRLVTWPLLSPTTLFVLVISVINAVKVFETVKTLTEGGPNKASEVLLYTIYQEGFSYLQVGYASAMTVVFLAILMVAMLIQYLVINRRTHYQ